ARSERELSPCVDVFSLGCVLFECLTGEPPFTAGHVMAVLAKILFEEPPKLRRVRPELPEALEVLLDRMLEEDPPRRLQDASGILRALDAASDPSAYAMTTTALDVPVLPSGPEDVEQHLVSVLIATPKRYESGDVTVTMAGEVIEGQ